MLASVQATHSLLAPSAVGGGGHPPVSRALHPAHLSPPARHPLPRLEAPLRRLPPPPTLGGRDPLTRSLVPLSGGYGPAFSAPAYAGGPSSDPKRESALIPPGVPGPAPGPAPGPGASIKEYCAVLTPFIYKLYCLVSDESTNALCCWTGAGDSFIVQDPTRFAASVLPNYFKHNQFSSFVRQLNKYRFHKLAPGAFLFGHDRFIRGRPDLLPEIGRQRSPDRVEKPAQQPAAEYGKRAAPARFESAPEAAYKRARPEGQMGPGQGQGDPELRAEVARLHAELQQNEARTRQLEEAVAGLQHTVGFLQAQAAAAAHGAPSYPPRPASYGHPYGSGGLPPPPTSKR